MIICMEKDNRLCISNPFLELVFDTDANGALVDVIDKAKGHCLLHQGSAPRTLFRLALRTPPGREVRWLDSRDAGQFAWRTDKIGEGRRLTLEVSGFTGRSLSVSVQIELDATSPFSRWKMRVNGLEGSALFNIACPIVSGLFEPGKPRVGEAIAVGRQGEGFLFENPFPVVDRLPLKMGVAPDAPRVGMGELHGMYPGSQQMQFLLYTSAAAGLYLATHDADGHFKSFDVGKMPAWLSYPYFSYGHPPKFSLADAAIAPPVMSISHFPGESETQTVAIDYETVVGVFQGDWQDGADIYKRWARRQWWCKRKLVEKDIPGWLREGFGVFLFANFNSVNPSRLDHPLGQIAEFVNDLSAEIGKPILAPVFNWEGQGPWTSPAGLFPPREGEAEFRRAMAALRKTGSLGCVSIPGDEWYLQLPFQPAAANFDCRKAFNAQARHLAITHADGQLYVRSLFDGWAQVQLCPHLDAVKTFMIDLYKQCLERGIVVIWNGGFPDGGDYACCYDPAHGHPLGFGRWWSGKYAEILEELNRECRAINPDFVHAGEGICEIFIPYLDLYDHRAGMFEVFSHIEENFPVGGRLIPLFNYVYSEYIGAFAAAFPDLNRPEVLYWARCIGKSLAQGAVPMGSKCLPEPQAFNPILLDFYKRVTRATVQECWKYVMFGELLRQPQIKVPRVEFSYLLGNVDGVTANGHSRHVVMDVAVECSAWRAPDGNIGYLFVNVTEDRVVFEVTLGSRDADGCLHDVDVVTNGRRERWLSGARLPATRAMDLGPLSVCLVECRSSTADMDSSIPPA